MDKLFRNNWVLIIVVLTLMLVGGSIIEYYSSYMTEKGEVEYLLHQRDSILRHDLECKVIKAAKIKYIDNLKAVPDSIFFLMVTEADKYNIPYVVFFRIMERESKFQFVKNTEGSSALGYMQIIKSTFKAHYDRLGLTGGHSHKNNIKVAAGLIDNIHNFWKKKFKNKRTAWEYTVAEYGHGRGPLMDSTGSYFIPDSIRSGINYVMKYYGK